MAENEQNINPDVDATQETPSDKPMEQFFFHQRRALEEMGKALEALLPPDFRKHGAEASKEFAKGFRVLVDSAIDKMKEVSEKEDPNEEAVTETPEPEPTDPKDDDDDDDRPSTTGKTKVRVKLD
jgi:hypothetical protein